LGSLLTARLGREILTLSAIGLRSRCGRWPGIRPALLVSLLDQDASQVYRQYNFDAGIKHIFLNPISNFKGVTLHLSEAVPALKINSVLRRDPDP
jgi:hypothetical protein